MSAAAKPSRAPHRKAKRRRPPTGGWWGEGPSPWSRWPGVSLQLDARWNGRRRRWESKDGRFYYDAEAAQLAVEFFPPFLRHHRGEFAGQPFDLLPYQADLVIRPVFGWKRTADGLRRFRKVFVMVPKGNGKSPLGAGTGLLLTFCDREDGAEVYSVAADREQALIVFDVARYMVQDSQDLADQAEVYRRSIVVPATRSAFKVLSSDVSTKHGFNIHGLIFDEFHAQRDRELYETLYRGMVKRRQPLMLLITTAGDDDEGICYEEYEYAKRLLSGAGVDETYLPVIFEAQPEDDWQAPATWERVNPGLGVTVKRDAVEAECHAAQIEPRKRNDFLRYHCNRWTNQAVSWIPVEQWDACKGTVTEAELKLNTRVTAGLDMAQKTDLTAFVVAVALPLRSGEAPVEAEVTPTVDPMLDAAPGAPIRLSLNFRLALIPYYWLPEETLRLRAHEDGIAYPLWREQGLLRATEGVMIDGDRIAQEIAQEIAPRYGLKGHEVGYDPAFASQIAIRLGERGLTMVEVLQNYKHLSEASQVFEALVRAGRVIHGGHRLLRWNVENVAVRQDDAGRIRPVKPKKNSTKRIDGVVAAIMALSRLLVAPEPKQSKYDGDADVFIVGGGSQRPAPSENEAPSPESEWDDDY